MELAALFIMAAWLGGIVAWIWLIVIACRESALSGILSLICGLYWLWYAISRIDRCWKPLVLNLCSTAVMIGAAVLTEAATKPSHELGRLTSQVQEIFKLGPQSQSLDPKEALDQLQGTWRVESRTTHIRQGRKVAETQLTILGDRCRAWSLSTDKELIVKVHPDKFPCGIDMVKADGSGFHGIYSVHGDRLTLCLAFPNEPRPKEFQSIAGRQQLFILQREIEETPSEAPVSPAEVPAEAAPTTPQ